MEDHFSSCQYCVDISEETIDIREAVVGVPEIGPSADFEYKLNRRISDLIYGSKGSVAAHKGKLPRWAALGAGLATGLAIGAVLLLSTNQPSTEQIAENDGMGEDYEMVVDTTTLPDDTLNTVNEPYQLDNRSRMVSGK